MLKQDYKDDCKLDDALMLAVKVLNKTLDSTRLSADKGEKQVAADGTNRWHWLGNG